MKFIITLLLLLSTSYATDMLMLTKKLNLIPGTKATIQWKRIFSSQRHLERYHLSDLDDKTKNKLKIYLIQHAADSDQPIVPGL